MMAIVEEDAPRKRKTHDIGEDLGPLSIAELRERIALLKDEIERIEAAIARKEASAAAADTFFRR